jgi:hypothetical protein
MNTSLEWYTAKCSIVFSSKADFDKTTARALKATRDCAFGYS